MFNLRGNCRTSGEQRRKEAGNVFGEGSRTPIAITILVRKPKKGSNDLASILYRDIGDYLTREDKLRTIQDLGSILSDKMRLSSIEPNEVGDWINQRDGLFDTFIPLGDKNVKNMNTIFAPSYSCGVKTNRDSWVYNYSRQALERNIASMIGFYNNHVHKFEQDSNKAEFEFDAQKISWSDSLKQGVLKHIRLHCHPECITTAMYRPFCKQMFFNYKPILERTYQIPRLFPSPQSRNLVICVSGVGARTFSVFITDTIPDLHILESGTQCFPLYWYEKNEHEMLSLFDQKAGEYSRRDAITDFILHRVRTQYGPRTTKEDVFYYVYGLLHAREYRERFASDLQKSLPRLPLVEDTKAFKAFAAAGRKLAALHLDYESIEPHPSVIIEDDAAAPTVRQMRFGKTNGKEDRSVIVYNDKIRIFNIPLRAYDWQVNGKSPIEWIMERYSVTVNRDSQIRNDPNDWCREHGQPRYILDLIGRIVNVSIQTLDLMASLPPLSFKT